MKLLHYLRITLTAVTLLTCAIASAVDLSGINLPVIRQCTAQDRDDRYARVCVESLNQGEIEAVKSMQFDDVVAYKAVEDGLILAAKMKKSDIGFYDRPAFGGEITTYLEPIDINHFAIKVRLRGIEKAKLNPLFLNFAGRSPFSLNIDGRDPSERTVVESWSAVLQKLQSQGARFEMINFPNAEHFDAKSVKVFRGSNCLKTIVACSVIYDTDGESLGSLISNAHAAQIPLDDFVLVGIPNPNEHRNVELLKGLDPDRFDAFLSFVVTNLRQTIEKGETPKNRYAAGFSNGGAWAFDALLFHPHFFDGSIVMSPAIWELKSPVQLKGKRVFVGAGELELGFLNTAHEIEKISIGFGAEVKTVYSKSGHSMNTWAPIWNLALRSLSTK
ncbi:hypothetical protein RF679_06520 [Undibacterium cyanobacteriorum]|uniref:Esterase n=1 Tax=Undibacterium cyanobacteriorum TaxID=3073561 RepID=A0ABY9RM92_9BURK|nr:hypothetical protein [Undibacterium sp. 20NA77.5]WMW81934.1 hypothetical protein RF679_06520 [Undibacterium sp. 20NA77.5]